MVWEVMQPVIPPGGEPDGKKTLMQAFLEQTGGRGGVQHVAFDCSQNLHPLAKGELVGEAARAEAECRRKEFESRGFPVAMSGIWHGKKGTCEFMFFDTQGAVGTCFETIVFSDDWEDPESVEWFPSKPE